MCADVAPLAVLSFTAGNVDLTDGLPLFALAALAWLFTYALHSTLLLGSAWIVTRRLSVARAGLRERIWKFALLSAFVTASLQVGMGFEPLGGRLPLRRAAAGDDSSLVAERPADVRERAPRRLSWDPGVVSPVVSPLISSAGAPALWYELLAKRALGKLEDGTGAAVDALLATAAQDDSGRESARSSEPRETQETLAASTAQSPWLARLGQWTQWAFATCVLGALGGLLLFALLWMRLNGCLRDRVELQHGALADKLRDLCRRAGIRRRVRLSVAPSLGAPISMGMFRPEICIPPRVLLELSEEEQEVLLAHELAHVARRDPLWLATCRLCEGVFFFQPLNRVARHEIEDCAEFLSDAWAVRQTGLRFSLASCLTRIAEWIVGERRSLPAPAMAHGRSRLRHRVELLLDETAAQRVERRPRWLGFACTGFCATLVAVVPCVSASEDARRLGDGGNIPFLPQHDSAWEKPVSVPTCEGEAAQPDAQETTASVAPEEEDASDDLDLSGEIAALSEEFTLLRAQALRFEGARAHEIMLELQQMEMKLTHLRELNSRIDTLRKALASTAPFAPPPATAPVREASSAASRTKRTADHDHIPSVNLEENSK